MINSTGRPQISYGMKIMLTIFDKSVFRPVPVLRMSYQFTHIVTIASGFKVYKLEIDSARAFFETLTYKSFPNDIFKYEEKNDVALLLNKGIQDQTF